MAWTDFHGLDRETAENLVTQLRNSLSTGQLVEVTINGVKTRYAENTSLDWREKVGKSLSDLQEYIWRLEQGHNPSSVIRPRAFRNRQTIVSNC